MLKIGGGIMNKKAKHWWLAALSVCAVGTSIVGVACGKEQGIGPQFLKGIQTDIELGDSIVMEHFIEYVTDSEYSIIITGPDGYEYDATKKTYWSPELPGMYTFTYTVEKGEFKGTNSFQMEVTVPKLALEYSMVNIVYDTGDVLVFQDYFRDMNIAAQSFYPWEMVMDSVTVGEHTVTFTSEDTSYTFTHSGPHVFKFHIQTQDGQKIDLQQSINVRHVEPETLAWMNENNIDAHNALRLDKDNKIVLDESIYSYKDSPSVPWGSTERHMASYVAFNGEYSFNDFVVFDFTGNNMPAITFFNEEINDNPFHEPGASDAQNKGLLFSNGWTTGMGKPFSSWETSINNRFCVYGPYKVSKVDWALEAEGWFRETISGGSGVGMTNLVKEENVNCSYRMALGVTAGDAGSVTITAYCINMTTGQVLLNATQTIVNDSSIEFPENYFTGSIVLYGMYGKETTLDAIYAIEEDTSMAALKDKYFTTSQFIDDAPTVVRIGGTLQTDEYIAPTNENYTLGYYDENNVYTAITSDTFSFTQSGLYKLTYCDGENLPAQMTIEIVDVDNATADFMADNDISFYNIVSAKDNKVILKASTHDGDPGSPGYGTGITSNMSYLAFNGEYGLNDYLVFDFTGNNMPFISFFNNQVTSNVFNNTIDTTQKGVVIGAGMYTPKGTIYNDGGALSKRVTMFGPNKCTWYDDTKQGQFRFDLDGDSPIALYNIKNSKSTYRVIVGFVGDGAAQQTTTLTVRMYVVDLTSGTKVCDYSRTVTCPLTDVVGSIALHGQFAKTTTIDKIYAIEENATMEDLIDKYASISSFKTTAKTEVYTNTLFPVSDYVQPENAQFEFYYTDAQGNKTQITGDTFSFAAAGTYTLHFVDGDKYPATLTVKASVRPSEFKPFVATTVQVGDVLNVSDYIVTVSGATYSFKYADAEGNETQITGDTFTFARPGTYTLFYTDGVNAEVTKTMTVNPTTSKFKATASGSVMVNQVLNVSDYIVTVDGAQYTLSYQDKDGVTLPISGNTFSFSAVGVYTLIYNDGVNLQNTLSISVADVSAAALTWLQQNNVSFYNMQSMDDNQKVVLGESTADGNINPNAQGVTRDMSYLAFNGNYGAGDYLVIEFTGNNMPYITFAAGSVTNDAWNVTYNEDGSRSVADMTDSGKGITVFNGYTRTDGTTCTCGVEGRLNFTGPFKMQNGEGDVENQPIRSGLAAHTNIGVNELVEGHRYRLIIGIYSTSGTNITFGVCLLNLTSGEQIYFTKNGISFDVGNADLSGVQGNLFEGSIILHGQFGKQTTLDKVYSIYEDWADVDEIKWSF